MLSNGFFQFIDVGLHPVRLGSLFLEIMSELFDFLPVGLQLVFLVSDLGELHLGAGLGRELHLETLDLLDQVGLLEVLRFLQFLLLLHVLVPQFVLLFL